MAHHTDSDIRALVVIQRKLDRWELEHLREHAAALAQRVEDLERDLANAQAQVQHLEDEVWNASIRADMFCDLLNEHHAKLSLSQDGSVSLAAAH